MAIRIIKNLESMARMARCDLLKISAACGERLFFELRNERVSQTKQLLKFKVYGSVLGAGWGELVQTSAACCGQPFLTTRVQRLAGGN